MAWWPFGKKKTEPAPEEKPNCPYCAGKEEPNVPYDAYDAYHKNLDKISDFLGDGKYRATLTRIEKILPSALFIDHEDIARHIEECFDGLCEDKTPQTILNLYDKLKTEGAAITFAEQHGSIKQIVRTFADSLYRYPEIKNQKDLNKAITFVTGEHPLLVAARTEDPQALFWFIDEQAQEVFDDWEPGENGDSLAEVIAAIQARG